MRSLGGVASLERSSWSTDARAWSLAWQEVLILLGLGALAVVLHAALDAPLKLPGHQGLVWMALLVVGRATSRRRWAASISSVGAAGLSSLPFWGFSDPFIWLIYLLPGLVMDLTYGLGKPFQQKAWFLAVVAGLAHAAKPLARVGISTVIGWPYGSLLFGLAVPLGYHVAFGLVGGLLGAGAVHVYRWQKQRAR